LGKELSSARKRKQVMVASAIRKIQHTSTSGQGSYPPVDRVSH
jgi:hypothetical protein